MAPEHTGDPHLPGASRLIAHDATQNILDALVLADQGYSSDRTYPYGSWDGLDGLRSWKRVTPAATFRPVCACTPTGCKEMLLCNPRSDIVAGDNIQGRCHEKNRAAPLITS